MKQALVVFGAVFALLGYAHAADLPDVSPDYAAAPAPATAYDWTGFYLGIQGGWQRHKDEYEDPIPPFPGDFDFDGAVLGGHLGYDYQMGMFVLGVVGDIEWADGSGFGHEDDPGGGVFGRAEVNWQGSVRARLGAAFDRLMVYGTGGLAFANYDFDYTCCWGAGPPVFGLGDQFSETVLGYTVGGGAAFAIPNSWMPWARSWEIWADYRFTDYEEASSGIVNCCAGPPNSQDHDVKTHAIRVGLSARF